MIDKNPCSENQLLAALPLETYQHLSPHFDLLSCDSGHVFCMPGEVMEAAYFPLKAMISLVSIMEDGSTTEISLVGNEGFVGLPIILGGEISLQQVVVQIQGSVLRLEASHLKKEFFRGETLSRLLLLYTHTRLVQVAQNAACNRQHSIEERLARWLLSAQACLCSNEVPLTQEFIAAMLGIRRSGVTVAASLLQRAGIIRYSRGHITILDLLALEEISCECHKIVQREYSRLLGSRCL
jgi:CRP-like cAMP-binding protein